MKGIDADGRPGDIVDLGAARSKQTVQRDAAEVRRQRAALTNGRRSRGFHERITQLLRARRRGADERVEQFDVVRDGSPGGTPIVSGTLLVRAALKEQQPDLLARLVSEVGPPAERLDGRLLVLSGSGAAPDRLVELAREVRGLGFEASVDHIVPLGVVCKGEGGPSATRLEVQPPVPTAAREGVRVGVIDTGIAVPGREHEWQSGLGAAVDADLLDAFPVPGGDGLLDAAAGHGSFAAGIVQQVDPGVSLIVARGMDSDGVGSEVRVAERVLQLVRKDDVEIVNLSLGAQTIDDQPLLAFQVALELLTEGGHDDVLLVAAAGNFGDLRPCWPAAFRRVVAVAGLTAELGPAAWSSSGFWVDVSAVGEGLVSTYVRGQEAPEFSGSSLDDWPLHDPRPWAVWTGTSFAAPQVAGEVARRLAAARAAGDGSATPHSIFGDMVSVGRRLPDYGVVLPILSGTSLLG